MLEAQGRVYHCNRQCICPINIDTTPIPRPSSNQGNPIPRPSKHPDTPLQDPPQIDSPLEDHLAEQKYKLMTHHNKIQLDHQKKATPLHYNSWIHQASTLQPITHIHTPHCNPFPRLTDSSSRAFWRPISNSASPIIRPSVPTPVPLPVSDSPHSHEWLPSSTQKNQTSWYQCQCLIPLHQVIPLSPMSLPVLPEVHWLRSRRWHWHTVHVKQISTLSTASSRALRLRVPINENETLIKNTTQKTANKNTGQHIHTITWFEWIHRRRYRWRHTYEHYNKIMNCTQTL